MFSDSAGRSVSGGYIPSMTGPEFKSNSTDRPVSHLTRKNFVTHPQLFPKSTAASFRQRQDPPPKQKSHYVWAVEVNLVFLSELCAEGSENAPVREVCLETLTTTVMMATKGEQRTLASGGCRLPLG